MQDIVVEAMVANARCGVRGMGRINPKFKGGLDACVRVEVGVRRGVKPQHGIHMIMTVSVRWFWVDGCGK